MTKSVQRGGKTPKRGTATRKASVSPRATGEKQKAPEKRAAVRTLTKQKQSSLYERAMKSFHAGDFAKAAEILPAVTDGPNREMAHSARMYQTVCERRLSALEPQLSTAEEHYDYAIALINRRQIQEARQHLLEALERSPDGDHVHYALALCYGLEGQVDAAATHLQRAVALNPGNRTAARNDPDFAPFADAPPVSAILFSGRNRSV